MVGVESKCTEHLSAKIFEGSFSPAYLSGITDHRRDGRWYDALKALLIHPADYRYLDAPQLVKHALGMARCYPEPEVLGANEFRKVRALQRT
jgi:hypothetical protein